MDSSAFERWEPIENQQAEMCAIGSMILHETGAQAVRSILKVSDFYRPSHRILFRAIERLMDAKSVIDMVTLSDELGDKLQDVGGLEYLIQVQEAVVTVHHAEHYAGIVKEHAVLRTMVDIGRKTLALAYKDDVETQDKVAQLRQWVVQVETGEQFAFSVGEVLSEVKDRPKWAVPTGFSKIDDVTLRNGLGAGKMHIVGGETGQGKSFLACQMVRIACDQGLRVCFVSLEMDRHDVVDRIVQQLTGYRDRTEADYCGEADAWDEAAAKVDAWDLVIIDSSTMEDGMTVETLTSWLAAQHMVEPWGYVLVDFAQLLTSSSRKFRDEWQVVKHAANKLRLFGMNHGPVVVLIVQIEKDKDRGHRVIGSQYLEKLASTFFYLDRSDVDEFGNKVRDDFICLKKNRYGKSKIKFAVDFVDRFCYFQQAGPTDPFRDDVRDGAVRHRQAQKQESIFRGSTDD